MEKAFQEIGRTAIITGGASGLGQTLALTLINEGFSVIVLDKMPEEKLDKKYFSKLKKYIELDLSDIESVSSIINNYFENEVIKPDVLIINAFPRIFKRFENFNKQDIVGFINCAFTGQLIILNYFLQKMIFNNQLANIIIIGSKSAVKGYSSGALYCSLKSAWITFHESLEKELASMKYNITVTTICPGSLTDTEGNKLSQYNLIVNKVKKELIKSINSSRSDIVFTIGFKSKLLLTFQILQKLLKVW
ncbi:MAG TPA: SDR family oxidoreductase [Bacteroidales bacterium]|nr:SDR family oxidoreductase [Bacteroidales bacterium]